MNLPILRDVRLLHADPFSQEMLAALRQDLASAVWTRFMVCYFNEAGYDALSPVLAKALRHPRSRGLITLTCACGAGAIERLAQEVAPPQGRLRVFLPLERERADDARLIHAKTVLIVRPRQNPGPFETPLEAVLYVGSNNWTGPGFRLEGGRKNVETSVRIVADWDPAEESRWLHLAEQAGTAALGNPILDALAQMHRCFTLASNTDLAQGVALGEIHGWMSANCRTDVEPPGATPFIVLTGVLAEEVDRDSARRGDAHPQKHPLLPRAGDSIYVQHFKSTDEPEVFDSNVTWAVLLWESTTDLERGEQPWLILGTARNLGQRNSGDPSLRTVPWIAFDPAQNSPIGAPRASSRGSIQPPQFTVVQPANLRSGPALKVEYWSVAPVAPGTTSGELNHRAPDRYALVEVVAVRAPRRSNSPEPAWKGTEIPFHGGKRRKRQRFFVVHDADGSASPERADLMRREQAQAFGLTEAATASDAGPTGTAAFEDGDVYECVAPINDLLFRGYEGEVVVAHREDEGRATLFEIGRFQQPTGSAGRCVPRMEYLVAPGVPHVAQALGLGGVVVERLGMKP